MPDKDTRKESPAPDKLTRETGPLSKITFERRAWYVPHKASDPPMPLERMNPDLRRKWSKHLASQREEEAKRSTWKPEAEAWDQLIKVHGFVGHRVRIQFWDQGTMVWLAEEEWPHPVEAQCDGVVTLIDDGFLQPFLMLRNAVEIETGGCSGLSHVKEHPPINATLAPLAEIHEIETALDAA